MIDNLLTLFLPIRRLLMCLATSEIDGSNTSMLPWLKPSSSQKSIDYVETNPYIYIYMYIHIHTYTYRLYSTVYHMYIYI